MDFLPEVVDNFEPEENDMEAKHPNGNIKVEVEDVSDDDDIPTTPTTTTGSEAPLRETIEDVMPKPKSKKEKLNVNEVFDLPKETPIMEDTPPTNVKLTKKGVPRKKRPPMSEEHKQKLALAREKAMASRKKKAADKKVAKALDNEEKELLKKQKHKRVQKLKEEVDEDVVPTTKPPSNLFTTEQLEEAQLNAIMNYEKIRKSRKAEKKEQQKKDMEQEALKQTIRRAVQPKQEFNPYAGICY